MSVPTVARISSSRSRSSVSLRKSELHRLVSRGSRRMAVGHWPSCSLGEDLSDRQGDARPELLFGREPPLAGRGHPVVLGAAPLGRGAPFSGDEPLLLEPMQHRKERARADLKRAARGLLDAVGDADAVPRLERQRP